MNVFVILDHNRDSTLWIYEFFSSREDAQCVADYAVIEKQAMPKSLEVIQLTPHLDERIV